MTTGKRVAVIGGGNSCEHQVSLASATAVRDALRVGGYSVEALTIGLDGAWWAESGEPLPRSRVVSVIESCDVVFPALHGPHGEDGMLAALCDVLARPCVGSGLGASALAMDKWAAKLVVQEAGVAVADGIICGAGDVPEWTGPVVVKPVAAGSSYGVSFAGDQTSLELAVAEALKWDSRALVEACVRGREIDVGVIEYPDGSVHAAPPLEILGDGIFDTATKYDGTARFLVPAPLSAEETAALKHAAITAFRALGCRGLARVDFFLTPSGVLFNEANTMPGMTEHSQLPRMFAADGMGYPELVGTLVATALSS
jgi:D-alanine-D-alanine ligase